MDNKDERIAELEARLADTEADSAQLISEIRLRRTAEAKLARLTTEWSKYYDEAMRPGRTGNEYLQNIHDILSDTTPPLAVESATVDDCGLEYLREIDILVDIPAGAEVTVVVMGRGSDDPR